MTDRLERARLLGFVAQDLDARGYSYAGIVRQAARDLLTLPDPDDPDVCPGCGQPVTQPATGRRRVWCSEACRSRTRRRHRPGTVR